MDDDRDHRALRGGHVPPDSGRGGPLPTRSLHAVGAGSDGAPLAGGAPPGAGAALPGDQQARPRVDDAGHARGALAPLRRGRLRPGARAAEAAPQDDRLTIAVPAKGRLREPAISLLYDAGLGPEEPGER